LGKKSVKKQSNYWLNIDILTKLATPPSLSICFSPLAFADDNHLKSNNTANFNDEPYTAENTTAADGMIMNTPTEANTLATDCGTDGSSANLQIPILNANLSTTPKGSYDSKITVFLSSPS